MRIWHRWKHTLSAGLAASLLASCAWAQSSLSPAPGPRRPSILFILADGLGCGDLGCYGQTLVKTPNLDQLAAEGMRFTSFYAGSPVPALSRAALFTGRHTGHLSPAAGADYTLSGTELTLGNLLAASGYVTAMDGAWGLGGIGTSGLPSHQGFQESYGFLSLAEARDLFPAELYRSSTEAGRERFAPVEGNENGNRGKFANDAFTEIALNFVRIYHPDKFNNFRPFFLYLAFTLPTAVVQAPYDAPYSNETWPPAAKSRAAMITAMDNDIGLLLQKLKQYQIDKNTIVIFTSDRGTQAGGGAPSEFFDSAGPLRSAQHGLYEGSLRVPLIIRWPFWMTGALTSDLPCALWDILPTAAEIARVQAPKDLDGISILPAITGHAQTNRHEFLYWESREAGFQQAARMDRWKAVRTGTDGPLELYDLKTDPGEKNNVAGQHPDKAGGMREYLNTARTPEKN